MVQQKINLPKPRTALITGAAGTLGQAISCELASRGYALAISDLDAEACVSLQTKLEESGTNVAVHRLDVTSQKEWEAVYSDLRNRWPQLGLLVNAAGCMSAGELTKTTWEKWSQVVDVNLRGTALGCHTFAEWLTAPDCTSHVMNIASVGGLVPLAWGSAYSVSKAGVVALSEALQVEWQPRNSRVTVVCPGFFESGLFENGAFTDDLVERVTQHFVTHSGITAEDVAVAAVNGFERGKLYVILPWRARWLHRMKRIAPTTFLRIASRQAHRLRASLRDS